MASEPNHQAPDTTPARDQPSEQEMRAAYEAELNRITSTEMILQTAVSLLNIGGRRLALGSPPASGPSSSEATPNPATEDPGGAERDMEQARDAIDGVKALLPILERRMAREIGPLRDALAQLQVAYAREASSAPAPTGADPVTPKGGDAAPERPAAQPAPGPAQSSGRLWVPGR